MNGFTVCVTSSFLYILAAVAAAAAAAAAAANVTKMEIFLLFSIQMLKEY
jgi:hypothetical protein